MKNIMNVDQIASCLDKIKMYKEQEQLLFEDITNCFEKLKVNYNSNNSKKINNFNLELTKKFNTISNVHANNMLVLEKSMDKYRITSMKAEDVLEDIRKGE